MTREEFIELPGNVQWAITANLAFGSDLKWDSNKDGERFWTDEYGERYTNDINLNALTWWLDISAASFDISIALDSRDGWWVRKCLDEKFYNDVNLPWAILMAAGISPSEITEPVMEDEK